MDIFAIIKENLPDGIEITDKAIKAIAKEISTQQGQEFIPKESYSKKTERIDELEKEIKELQGKSTDADDYKTKYETELEAHKTTKETLTKKYDDFVSETKNKEVAAAKQSILYKQLAADGANPKLIKLLEKEFDLTSIEIDGEGDAAKIKGWDKLAEPIKAQYAEVFGKVENTGVNISTPPPSTANTSAATGNATSRMNNFIRGKGDN